VRHRILSAVVSAAAAALLAALAALPASAGEAAAAGSTTGYLCAVSGAGCMSLVPHAKPRPGESIGAWEQSEAWRWIRKQAGTVSSSWPCTKGLCNSWIGRPVYKYELRDDDHLCAASSGQDVLTRDCDGNAPQLWIETSNGHEVSVSRTDAARNEQNMCSLTNGLPLTVVSSTGCTTIDDEKWSWSSAALVVAVPASAGTDGRIWKASIGSMSADRPPFAWRYPAG
jgi:hypothetical protein